VTDPGFEFTATMLVHRILSLLHPPNKWLQAQAMDIYTRVKVVRSALEFVEIKCDVMYVQISIKMWWTVQYSRPAGQRRRDCKRLFFGTFIFYLTSQLGKSVKNTFLFTMTAYFKCCHCWNVQTIVRTQQQTGGSLVFP
jgi:hypothetical protein